MSDINPYASPNAAPTLVEANYPAIAPVSRLVRLLNYLLDSLASMMAALVVALAVIQLLGGSVPAKRAEVEDIGVLAALLTMFAYYVGCEYFLQRTPAKFITSSKVYDYYGNKPALWRILVRNLVRLIPLDLLSFALGRSHPRGLHDLLSGTVVGADR